MNEVECVCTVLNYKRMIDVGICICVGETFCFFFSNTFTVGKSHISDIYKKIRK